MVGLESAVVGRRIYLEMSLKKITDYIGTLGSVSEIFAELAGQEHGRRDVIVPQAVQVGFTAALWQSTQSPLIAVAATKKSALSLYDELRAWCGSRAPVYLFPADENPPLERVKTDAVDAHLRLTALNALRNHASSAPLVVTTASALAYKLPDPKVFDRACSRIKVGEEVSQEALLKRWSDAGYKFDTQVDIPGSMSRRGYILDVFPVNLKNPVRLEFFGDEIETIREFNVNTQRSIKETRTVEVVPALEMLPAYLRVESVLTALHQLNWAGVNEDSRELIQDDIGRSELSAGTNLLAMYSGLLNKHSLKDYLPDNAVLMYLNPDEVEDEARIMDASFKRELSVKNRQGELPADFPAPYLDWGTVQRNYAGNRVVGVRQWGAGRPDVPIKDVPFYALSTEEAVANICELADRGERVMIASAYNKRVQEELPDRIKYASVRKITRLPEPGEVLLVGSTLKQGFCLEGPDKTTFTLLSDTELFGFRKRRTVIPERYRGKRPQTHLDELEEGMYVVHIDQGIGKFAGIRSMGESKGEYVILEYAEGDKIYVPISSLDRIQIYKGAMDKPIKLTRLGTREWSNAKRRARKATEVIAGELLAIAAARKLSKRKSYGEDGIWQAQFEDGFPYEETPDQLRVTDEVKRDLEGTIPLDRLISGDVGYGKTEVAMRAAFKVATANKQVAVLAPTTLLASQHYETFTERMRPFPLRVEMLSSLVSPEKQREVLEDMLSGKVDVVVGTHRLLQRDIKFARLGMFIVDEEHRFGVKQKEQLKRARSSLDVLSMSATPIPRSLYMAMIGTRDISTIETPPRGRLPTHTFVAERTDKVLQEAIRRELTRNGQVFAVHNRVYSLNRFAEELSKLVPEASIAVAHGQMEKVELEHIASGFINGEYDVLACTTIVEAGIDIPNVNTLLVDRADTFGLAQLYQLRGRVGRGYNRGYAYFLLQKGQRLNYEAMERLNVMLDNVELGAGFKIARRDMQLRGVGNILGSEQSGHINSIGVDMYLTMLKEAMSNTKKARSKDGEEELQLPQPSNVKLDLEIPAVVPAEYVEDLPQRLNIYQRLAVVDNEAAVEDLEQELRDRFGPLPIEAKLLLGQSKIQLQAANAGIASIHRSGDHVVFTLESTMESARDVLRNELSEVTPEVRMGNRQIRCKFREDPEELLSILSALIKCLYEFRERMFKMLAEMSPEPNR